MHSPASPKTQALGLRAGDWVEVRSAEDILATLDSRGNLDALPFMPEMLQFCGKRFRVFKSAHKTCDTIENYRIPRRMTSAVHLEGLRCDGGAHGGCQAGCLLFWKEAWLKRASSPGTREDDVAMPGGMALAGGGTAVRCDTEALYRATHALASGGEIAAVRYSCQATELLRATTPLRWWAPGHYLKDLTSGNVRLSVLIRHVFIAAFNIIMRLNWRGWRFVYPYLRGQAGEKTPTEVLNIQSGELVQVRSKDEIMRTVNTPLKNRGLSFDVEMVPYCGRTYRVLRRVEKIIDEKSGRMISMRGDCLILEGVTCGGCFSRYRLFCPRSIYPYWREIWLKRVEPVKKSA